MNFQQLPTSQTLEVRWFIDGEIPSPFQEWFQDRCPGKPVDSSKQRTDYYFCLPHGTGVNLKLRQGNLELKWQQQYLGIRQFGKLFSAGGNQVTWQGHLEVWWKWSHQHISGFADTTQLNCIPVQKTRSRRVYQGVYCELTQLQVKKQTYWTLAFEMPVDGENSVTNFEQVINWITKTNPNFSLSLRQSQSYARWLNTHYFS
ncbi:MAG: hypothetical protein SAJ12_23720 [Jaaginema sp. PMC 1079.18]|nr:hypothetical protein [Jaaginema sp. PMC 1080.18]MEC4854002.1 hypothetical protein [Jaaginema sp. PMC 1079.18]MEC4865033.1 hypothetical protein [Jaaginema sp. PMC 1078.18]